MAARRPNPPGFRPDLSDRGETMKPALSRGDAVALKIDSTPQAIVVSTGILSTAGLVGFLVWSGWNSETIVGFAALAIGLFASQFANARKTSQLDAKQDNQTAKLDTVLQQTNGELKATVAEAVETGISKAVAVYRHEQEQNR